MVQHRTEQLAWRECNPIISFPSRVLPWRLSIYSFRFVTSISFILLQPCYGSLLIASSTDGTSVVCLLQTLDGNIPFGFLSFWWTFKRFASHYDGNQASFWKSGRRRTEAGLFLGREDMTEQVVDKVRGLKCWLRKWNCVMFRKPGARLMIWKEKQSRAERSRGRNRQKQFSRQKPM